MAKVSKQDQREAIQARAEAVSDNTMTAKVYDQRHTDEIERAENVAAGLPPNTTDEQLQEQAETSPATPVEQAKPQPAPEKEKPFEPIPVAEPNRGVVDKIVQAHLRAIIGEAFRGL